jgi:hypothetical protein
MLARLERGDGEGAVRPLCGAEVGLARQRQRVALVPVGDRPSLLTDLVLSLPPALGGVWFSQLRRLPIGGLSGAVRGSQDRAGQRRDAAPGVRLRASPCGRAVRPARARHRPRAARRLGALRAADLPRPGDRLVRRRRPAGHRPAHRRRVLLTCLTLTDNPTATSRPVAAADFFHNPLVSRSKLP